MASSTPLFFIDMNSVRGDQVGTLLSHASDPVVQFFPPDVGDPVLVITENEDQCVAFVESRDDDWLGLTLAWEYWMPSLKVQFVDDGKWGLPLVEGDESTNDTAGYVDAKKNSLTLGRVVV